MKKVVILTIIIMKILMKMANLMYLIIYKFNIFILLN